MRLKTSFIAALSVTLVAISAGSAQAAPLASNSPNLEEPFPVVCAGTTYTLVDAPASLDHADFTPAFAVDGRTTVIPYMFDATQTATSLTDGAVFDGVTYNSGDVIFSGSESTGIGTKRHGGVACTFGGSGTETFTDDNGMPVDVEFTFSGTAMAVVHVRK